MTESEGGWLPIMHQWVGGQSSVEPDRSAGLSSAGRFGRDCSIRPGCQPRTVGVCRWPGPPGSRWVTGPTADRAGKNTRCGGRARSNRRCASDGGGLWGGPSSTPRSGGGPRTSGAPPNGPSALQGRSLASLEWQTTMSRPKRLMETILLGRSVANIRFDNLRALMRYLGFEERVRGGHHLFDKEGVVELVNLQSRGGQAKPLSGEAGSAV